jgi:hypothetical protein
VIQSTRNLHDGFTGTETAYNKFDFVGKVLQTKQTQNFYSAATTKTTTTVDKFYFIPTTMQAVCLKPSNKKFTGSGF